jgi:hypothetical protein
MKDDRNGQRLKNGYISSPFCGLWVPCSLAAGLVQCRMVGLDPEPLRCHRRDDVDCIRGENAYIYAWVPLWIPWHFFVYISCTRWGWSASKERFSSRREVNGPGDGGCSKRNSTPVAWKPLSGRTATSMTYLPDSRTRLHLSAAAISEVASGRTNSFTILRRHKGNSMASLSLRYCLLYAYLGIHCVVLNWVEDKSLLFATWKFLLASAGFITCLSLRIKQYQKKRQCSSSAAYLYSIIMKWIIKASEFRATSHEDTYLRMQWGYGSGLFPKINSEEGAFSLPRQQEDNCNKVVHENCRNVQMNKSDVDDNLQSI